MPKVPSTHLSNVPIFPKPVADYKPHPSHQNIASWLSFRAWKDPYHTECAAYWLDQANQIRERLQENMQHLPYRTGDLKDIQRDLNDLCKTAERYMKVVRKGDTEMSRKLVEQIMTQVKDLDVTERRSNRAAELAHGIEKLKEAPVYQSLVKRRLMEASLANAIRTVQHCNIAFREDIIRRCAAWLDDDNQKHIFWIHGEPGCGKTVITYWFAQFCSDQKMLAASYQFSQKSNRDFIRQTFLGNLITDFQHYLGEAFTHALARSASELSPLMSNEIEFFARDLKFQFVELVVPAFRDIGKWSMKPLLVVLDDMDKCDEWAAKSVFELIKVAIETLPICFFISGYQSVPIDHYLRGELSGHVEMCEVPFYANPRRNKVPTMAADLTNEEKVGFGHGSPRMTPLPDVYPAGDDENEDVPLLREPGDDP